MILKVAFKNEDSIKGLQELLNNYPLILQKEARR